MPYRLRARALAFSMSALLSASAVLGQTSAPSKEAVDSFNVGMSLIDQKKVKDSIAKFRQATTLSPDWAEAHGNLGMALLVSGDAAAALPELEQTTKLKPTAAAAWATLGQCYQSLGRTQDAIPAFNKYLELEPNGALATKIKSLVAVLQTEQKRAGGMADRGQNDYLNEAVYGGLARWNTPEIKVYIKPGDAVPGYKPGYTQTLKQSFEDWEKNSQGKLHFVFVDKPFGAQINCSWTDTTKDGVSAAEGGHTVLAPDGNGGIVTASMMLLTVPVQGNDLSTDYVKRVDLHEIGHALGIMGHSKDPDDIMYMSIVPGCKSILTNRDLNTILALYSDEAVRVAGSGIDTSKLVSGDPSTVLNRVVALNNEAKALFDKGNIQGAVGKMEEAHKLDPNNALVCTNLGSAYSNMANMYMLVGNFPVADSYFKKAIPLLEHGSNSINLCDVLKGYSMLLHRTNRAPEAAKIDAKIKALGGR